MVHTKDQDLRENFTRGTKTGRVIPKTTASEKVYQGTNNRCRAPELLGPLSKLV